MKSLYESLLDDFEDINKNVSKNYIKELKTAVKAWVSKCIFKTKGRIKLVEDGSNIIVEVKSTGGAVSVYLKNPIPKNMKLNISCSDIRIHDAKDCSIFEPFDTIEADRLYLSNIKENVSLSDVKSTFKINILYLSIFYDNYIDLSPFKVVKNLSEIYITMPDDKYTYNLDGISAKKIILKAPLYKFSSIPECFLKGNFNFDIYGFVGQDLLVHGLPKHIKEVNDRQGSSLMFSDVKSIDFMQSEFNCIKSNDRSDEYYDLICNHPNKIPEIKNVKIELSYSDILRSNYEQDYDYSTKNDKNNEQLIPILKHLYDPRKHPL
jgi:hypothetical protein